MTEKRYFKKMWEEEYYIFDSNTISESDFEEKVEYEDYKAFEDSMMGDEVVDRLNEQHETIKKLKKENDELIKCNQKLLGKSEFDFKDNWINHNRISIEQYLSDKLNIPSNSIHCWFNEGFIEFNCNCSNQTIIDAIRAGGGSVYKHLYTQTSGVRLFYIRS